MKNITKKITFSFISALFVNLLIIAKTYAICPVCTVAVAGGVGISRWLGIDDTISGLWIGGLTVSLIMWTINWFKKKNIRFPGRKILTAIAYYALVVLPLYYLKIDGTTLMGHPGNKLLGIDKLLLGIIIGSIAFLIGASYYQFLKAKNNGHAHFPFQKIVMAVGPLIILSAVFYFITK